MDYNSSIMINFQFNQDDVNSKIAYNAFAHSNSQPRELAERVKQIYFDNMQAMFNELSGYATTDNKQSIESDLIAYKTAYLSNLHSWLQSRASFVSPFIAGRSNYKHEQMMNRARRSDKMIADGNEKIEKMRLSIIKKYKPLPPLPTLTDYEIKLEKAIKNLAFAKKVNKIMLDKEISGEQKAKLLSEIGTIPPENIAFMVENNFKFSPKDMNNFELEVKKWKKKIKTTK